MCVACGSIADPAGSDAAHGLLEADTEEAIGKKINRRNIICNAWPFLRHRGDLTLLGTVHTRIHSCYAEAIASVRYPGPAAISARNGRSLGSPSRLSLFHRFGNHLLVWCAVLWSKIWQGADSYTVRNSCRLLLDAVGIRVYGPDAPSHHSPITGLSCGAVSASNTWAKCCRQV